MYSLTLNHGQTSDFFKSVANPGEIKIKDDTLLLKNDILSGYFKDFNLPNGVQCLCANFSPRKDFYLYKMPVASEFFTLSLHEIFHSDYSLVMADRKYQTEMEPKSNSVLLLSSLNKSVFFVSKNSKIKTVEISIPRDYLLSQIKIDCSYELLKYYIENKARKKQVDFSNFSFNNLFLNITGEVNKKELNLKFLEENVNRLLEIYISDITSHLNDFIENEKVKISIDEISRLMAVKSYLDQNICLLPPSFSSLTKIALMSGTSLKTKFRKMYGSTMYEYFQRLRMQRARILLLTHKYSVKQIGRQLGYTNLNNFTIAFKKEFNQLPHLLLK
jgi:AraC-like DNA-binding protein